MTTRTAEVRTSAAALHLRPSGLLLAGALSLACWLLLAVAAYAVAAVVH